MDASKGVLGVEDMRGTKQILQTGTFLVNDNEPLRWRCLLHGKLVKFRFVFMPRTEIVSNPPIEIEADSAEKETVVKFIGWNASVVYHIDHPVHVTTVNNRDILLSVVCFHLGVSNMCTLQLYSVQ